MALFLGTTFSIIASIAILISLYSFYQLHRIGKLHEQFRTQKVIKFVSLYSFWFLLLGGGILLMKASPMGILITRIAFSVIAVHVSIKLLASAWIYFQGIHKQKSHEEEGSLAFLQILKKSLIGNVVGWVVVIAIVVIVFWLMNGIDLNK